MPVIADAGVARLNGVCGPEEAETLQGWLLAHPAAAVDVADCEHLHCAVLQVLMAAARPLAGQPADPALKRCLDAALGAAVPPQERDAAPGAAVPPQQENTKERS